ncbi:hypothetical protein Micbo1qcDRAFT_215360 [Microdochium bolleyi]|uniref:ThiJ/PfpI family protein n=1 Tax=Microdochium bolleyi TaxID=196109 RepID=A0A136IT59_9PEZI|nr:hypothetical protein Micbo1qcDRAFT_215360 [Microdochium bolleyi]
MADSKPSPSQTTSDKATVHVGVFIPAEAQLLDFACIDIIGSMSASYMAGAAAIVPASVLALAPPVQFYYIGSVQPGSPIATTSSAHILCTHHYTDPAVAPGKLDIVVVPGPDPFATDLEMDGGAPARWLADQGASATTDVLSVCTGILWCGAAGLLKGKTVCGPRGMGQFIEEQKFGQKELVGHKVRWWQDGRFWSSGGITNGNDLIAAYCRATPRLFPRPLVEIACEMTDVGDRAQQYSKSQTGFIATMVWNTFRAWLMGSGTSKGKTS